MEKNVFDVLIIGSGIAGLYAALQFRENVDVLIISKNRPEVSGSALAQGGVAAVLQHEDDSFDFHLRDTLTAGGHKNTIEAVEQLTSEGPGDVRRIMQMGVDFDSDENGVPLKTLEGGHSRRRIVHHLDQTGKEIVEKLLKTVRGRKNITLMEETTACSAKRSQRGFRINALKGGVHFSLFAGFLILATGGIGRVYRHTTNPVVSTGDGIRIAHELGAKIKNISLIQFHPTAFNLKGCSEQFLISEAVRGEGAFLLNCSGERFMHRYDSRLELAPRDVVSRSIIREAGRTGSNDFYLDIRHKGRDFVYKRFPAISAACLERGVDMAEEPVPVFPCQHYLMGGIDVDLNSRTTVPRLYAAGECAHTGVHGGNRLASNSLPEALVFGRHASQDIQKFLDEGFARVEPFYEDENLSGRALPEGTVEKIQDIMQESYFVIPEKEKVFSGLEQIKKIFKALGKTGFEITKEYCEAKSLATVAMLILEEGSGT